MANEERKTVGGIVDFDAVAPEKRLARIAGKVIDVTMIPAKLSLELARFSDQAERGELDNETTLNRMFDLVSEVCQVSDPDVTTEWLLESTSFEQLFDFIDYVIEPLRSRGNRKASRAGKKKAGK